MERANPNVRVENREEGTELKVPSNVNLTNQDKQFMKRISENSDTYSRGGNQDEAADRGMRKSEHDIGRQEGDGDKDTKSQAYNGRDHASGRNGEVATEYTNGDLEAADCRNVKGKIAWKAPDGG